MKHFRQLFFKSFHNHSRVLQSSSVFPELSYQNNSVLIPELVRKVHFYSKYQKSEDLTVTNLIKRIKGSDKFKIFESKFINKIGTESSSLDK